MASLERQVSRTLESGEDVCCMSGRNCGEPHGFVVSPRIEDVMKEVSCLARFHQFLLLGSAPLLYDGAL